MIVTTEMVKRAMNAAGKYASTCWGFGPIHSAEQQMRVALEAAINTKEDKCKHCGLPIARVYNDSIVDGPGSWFHLGGAGRTYCDSASQAEPVPCPA